MGDEGCDLQRLVAFIKNGLVDRRSENFKEKALDERLTVAQQWLVLHLCLKDGIPEWVRDEENDENTPELKIPEPVQQNIVSKTLSTAMKPVQSLAPKKTAPAEEVVKEETPEE